MSNVVEYKCPNCGAPIEFDPKLQKVHCQYCDTEFEIEDVKNYNEELENGVEDKLFWDSSKTNEYTSEELKELNVYHCESCGSEIVANENTSATTCPYCNSTVLLKGRLSGSLKPDYIIPFKNSKEDITTILKKYLKNKLFLRKEFLTGNKIEEIKGLYVPFWVYDAKSNGRVNFRGETYREWSSGDFNYRETKHYLIVRDGSLVFEHIPADGSKNIDDNLMESIEPFDFSEAKEFSGAYLTGHYSEKYDVTSDECLPRINERIKNGTIDQFRKTVHGFHNLRLDSTNIRLEDSSVCYALYPVWLLNSKFDNKNYTFAMNGETGKIVGNLPMSKAKYALWFLILNLLAAIIVFLLFFLYNTYFELYTVPVSILFGMVPAIIFCEINKKRLKDIKHKKQANDYVKSGSLNLRISREIFLYKDVSKTRIIRENGGQDSRR